MRWLAKSVMVSVLLGVALAPGSASAQQSATVAAQRVAMRAAPASGAQLVAMLPRGTSVTVLERRDPWAKVSARSRSGWVRTNSLSFVAGEETRSESPRPAVMARRSGDLGTGALGIGDNVLGPVVGIGDIGGAVAVGGEFEHAIKPLPSLANGMLTFSAQAFYYHWSTFGTSFTGIPLGAAANYHFVVNDRRIDPFVGLGLGYTIASTKTAIGTYTDGSGLFFWGRAGVRYFLNPGLALHVDAGLGSSTLNLGLMFRP